ncbi:hypothetical protein M758_UG000500 [Ceratodon purpureus]|nr:hypothetical protein M758_UG000500 [Ceratodon purpureus]
MVLNMSSRMCRIVCQENRAQIGSHFKNGDMSSSDVSLSVTPEGSSVIVTKDSMEDMAIMVSLESDTISAPQSNISVDNEDDFERVGSRRLDPCPNVQMNSADATTARCIAARKM